MIDRYKHMMHKNIELHFIEGHEYFAKKAFESLKSSYKKLKEYFELQNDISIRVVLAPNRLEFEYIIISKLNVSIEIPSRSSRIAQPNKSQLVLLSPIAYETESSYKYKSEDFERLIFHELVHMFQDYLIVDSGRFPIWFKEGQAIYLSGQWNIEPEFKDSVEKSLSKNEIPTLREINNNVVLSYEWGGVLLKYIDELYGREGVVDITKNCTHRYIFEYLEWDLCEYENKWRNWVLKAKEEFFEL